MKLVFKMVLLMTALMSTMMAAEYTLRLTHVVSPETPKGMAAEFFAKRVFELSHGQVDVKVYPNGQLYGDGEEIKALRLGHVEMAIPSLSKFTSIVPEMQLFDLPFLFRDKDHLYKVLDGDIGQSLKDKVSAKGFVALEYWDAGFKHFSSSKKPILVPYDVKGQNFRVMNSHVLEAQFKLLGAHAQALSFAEVYNALQKGTIDGSENPLTNFYTQKFYEVQSHLTLSSHGYLGYLVIVSEHFWKKFPMEYKPILLQAMKEATEYERKLAIKDNEETLEKLNNQVKSGKFLIHTLTDEQKAMWHDSMKALYPQFYKVIGEDVIKKVQQL